MINFLIIIFGVGGFIFLVNKISQLELRINELTRGKSPEVAPVVGDVHDPSRDMNNPIAPVPATPLAAMATPQPEASPVFDEASGGKWLGWLGIVALFIGIGFFLKYAFDNNLIGPTGRVLLGIVAGVVAMSVGQSIRKKYEQYSYVLIGGGAAILYLSFYAAYNLYYLVSQPVTFLLMICTTAAVVVLSVVDESKVLAVLATLGGFGTPYLLGNGTNDPVSLFTYISILDIALVGLALKRRWSSLVYILFCGTALQYLSWYWAMYMPEQLPIAIFFTSLFFCIFLVLPILNSALGLSETKEEDMVLATAVGFGYYFAVYGLLNPLYHDSVWFFALVIGVIYYALSYLVFSLNKDDSTLALVYFSIATAFLSFAIYLKLEHTLLVLAWLIEALILFVIAFQYKHDRVQVLAIAVYVVGLLKLFWEYVMRDTALNPPFANQYFFLFLLAIGIAYAVSYWYSRFEKVTMGSTSESLTAVFFFVANALTVFILTSEVSAIYDRLIAQSYTQGQYYHSGASDLQNQRNTTISILWSVYSVLLISIGFGARVQIARILGLGFFFLTALKIFIDIWSLGELYRTVASIVFGGVALLGSFLYVRYSQRIKEMIYEP